MRSIPVRVLLFLALSTPALASDGVLEINQACATSASGCFPGDAVGFPITITQPGSYRLTGNLSVPVNTTAIQINAAIVTLDLGGFVVSGPNLCTPYPVTTCTSTGGPPGIVSSQYLTTVRNGSVVGMSGTGILLSGASSEIDSVKVLSSGLDGITLGGASRVAHSFSGSNWSRGIYLNDSGGYVVDDNEARGNAGTGLEINQTARLVSTASRNRLLDNGGTGMIVGLTVPISKNIASGNSGSTILGGHSLGDNSCNGVAC